MLLKKQVWAQTLLLLVVVLFTAAGCHTPAGRSAGDVVDDTTIGAKVKTELFQSSELSGFAIDVNVFEGEVTLTGGVDTQYQKELAAKIARSVTGVRGVNNLITVKQ